MCECRRKPDWAKPRRAHTIGPKSCAREGGRQGFGAGLWCGVKPSGFLTPDEVTDLVRVAVLLALNGCHANAGQVRDILNRNKGTAPVPMAGLVIDPSEPF